MARGRWDWDYLGNNPEKFPTVKVAVFEMRNLETDDSNQPLSTDIKESISKRKSYERYVALEERRNDEISAKLIIALDDMLDSGYRDFLLVQAAGNGCDTAEGEEPYVHRNI